ncbi:hypothetical protein ACFE04_004298 [Oxalis oulophora]
MDCGDFITYLEHDMSTKILTCLRPSDNRNVCLVSKLWYQFVMTTEVYKKYCLKNFPEISSYCRDIEENKIIELPATIGGRESSTSVLFSWKREMYAYFAGLFLSPSVGKSYCEESELILSRNHNVYAILAQAFSPVIRRDCLLDAIVATSNECFSENSITNTLSSNSATRPPSYWSSKGNSDAEVPEALTYKLVSDMCLITEIHIQPLEASLRIYSSRSVRFRMGHPKDPSLSITDYPRKSDDGRKWADDNIVWTYTSPEFPMAHYLSTIYILIELNRFLQNRRIQKFKFPEPVLCVGGFLEVELLGRVQRKETDGLYYICITHVEVVGRPLLQRFDVDILDASGKCSLKYYSRKSGRSSTCELKHAAEVERFLRRMEDRWAGDQGLLH